MKKYGQLFLILCLLLTLCLPVHAETFGGGDDWKVTFTADEKMESSFKTGDLTDAVGGLQPGDNIIFKVTLENTNDENTNWYMTNEILSSFEDSAKNAAGGAYAYNLTYTSADGEERVLYSSDTVGGDESGENGSGLHEVGDVLGDYFYLDTLAKGQTGVVSLEIALDGETQGNDYQSSLADLQMNFAVEIATEAVTEVPAQPTKPIHSNIVKTGDTTNFLPYFVGLGASGLIILILAIVRVRKGHKEKEA